MVKLFASKKQHVSDMPVKFSRMWPKVAGIAVMMAVAMGPVAGSAMAASGGDTIQSLYNELLATMRNGPTLGQTGRFMRLQPVIHRSFDLPLMTRLSVGPTWATLNDNQRQQLTESFARYISATYAERFDSYSGQKLRVTGQRPAAAGVIVNSEIVKTNGEPVEVDYLLHQNGDSWLISDVYLDGTISELATRRSEFAAILRSQGVDGLIAALNHKAEMLTSATARAG
jgi:phospholipid transport system substrate-binding protein